MNAERRGGAHRAEVWPSIPAVLRVMAGWFLLGIGALNLAVEVDGGLTGTYLIFHAGLMLGGLLLLTRRRPWRSRTGLLLGTLTGLAGMIAGAVPDTSRCCLADHPGRRGYPYPFLGTGDGIHLDVRYLLADLVFWGCAGLLVLVLAALVERRLPERRTPVDVVYVGRHAEPEAIDEQAGAIDDQAGEEAAGRHAGPDAAEPGLAGAGSTGVGITRADVAGTRVSGARVAGPGVAAGHAEPGAGGAKAIGRHAEPDADDRRAEPDTKAATPDRAGENVGGLT